METIGTGPLESDAGRFLTLLEAVRDAAREDGHWKAVSVSLGTSRLIDPLAVLASIHEQGQRHCYIEHPEKGIALAGAEPVIERGFAGGERFAQARDFARELFDNTIAVGQLDLPMAGPKLFCAFTFEDDLGTLFLPRWQVSSAEGAYVATANLLVEPDGDIEGQARRILDAYAKFSTFDYSRARDAGPSAAPVPIPGEPEASADSYRRTVDEALGRIRAGECGKVVLSRRMKLASPRPPDAMRILARLRERFPSCHTFSFSDGAGRSFIGASPERLVEMTPEGIRTEALAGTAPRGRDAEEDAAHAAALFADDKQMREHAFVARTIHAQLLSLGLEVGPMPRPRLRRLPNAQHIHTPFRAPAKEGLHLFDVAQALHPTPATAGIPRDKAMRMIGEIEDGPRGLFCGLVGWTDPAGGGSLTVGIRSGIVEGSETTLFAGAGIVEGSRSEQEEQETMLKMSALADLL